MAIIREGALIGGISGSLGGLTFANSGNGTVVKHRPIKVRKHSRTQMLRRAAMERIHSGWIGLTAKEKNAWIWVSRMGRVPNRLGVERYLSAYQWFVAMNVPYMMYVPGGLVRWPPAYGRLEVPYDLDVVGSAGGSIDVTFVLASTPLGTVDVMIYGARPQVFVKQKRTWRWRFLDARSLGGGAQNEDITTEFDAAFGHPRIGELILVKVYSYSTNAFRSPEVSEWAFTGA